MGNIWKYLNLCHYKNVGACDIKNKLCELYSSEYKESVDELDTHKFIHKSNAFVIV